MPIPQTGDELVAGTFDRCLGSLDVPPAPVGEIERRAHVLRARHRRSAVAWAMSGVAALALALSCAASPPGAAFASSVRSAARAALVSLTARGRDAHAYRVTAATADHPRVTPAALAGRAALALQSSVVADDGSTSWTSAYRVNGTSRTLTFIERPSSASTAPARLEQRDVAAALTGARSGAAQTFAHRRTVTVRGVSVTGLSAATDAAVVDRVLRSLR